ncbi:hypothetical protein LXM25_11460 [Dyadobacter sp. LJ53]|uniref:hypothetical protein n=1 Tax=Dyadobacter chenwenxiniae TaxID=2906456 RepID=UPI001F3081BD|nr:hypothetical protein [Dyadobacter chenwenxiniae]MCF0050679.1 hypothetical protein [Dyadobacter chenwenxiniae]
MATATAKTNTKKTAPKGANKTASKSIAAKGETKTAAKKASADKSATKTAETKTAPKKATADKAETKTAAKKADTEKGATKSADKPATKTAEKSAPKSTSKSSGKKASDSDSKSNTTTNHDEIRAWVEQRGGKPATVKGTNKKKSDAGILRIDFPGYSGDDTLEEISWDEFFQKFDEGNLQFLHQTETADGKESRFNKFISK